MSAREWTREEAYAAFVEEGKKAPGAVMADEYVGRALLTLRHERDLLAAECRAWRRHDDLNTGHALSALEHAMDAVDAAGVLERTRMAGRALAAEQAGKEWNPPGKDTDYRLVMDPAKPDTSREDAALASYLIKLQDQDMLCFGSDGIALVAACRKAREPKPRYHVAAGVDKGWRVIESATLDNTAIGLTEAQARAVADALNALERAK